MSEQGISPDQTPIYRLTRHGLKSVGQALFGDLWQSELARHLGVQPRAVQRWLSGERDIPKDLHHKLKILTDQRASGLMLARSNLERIGQPIKHSERGDI